MNIKQYLDSTYLKTAAEAGISDQEDKQTVVHYIEEAIDENFKLIMIRPKWVTLARTMIDAAKASVLVGTVIDFPNGNSDVEIKLEEARQAIADGADDLDFVCNHEAFKKGQIDLVKKEILLGTKLGLDNFKTVKWIIEVAALNPQEIVRISALIKNVVVSNFKEEHFNAVFVKSSTGFYITQNGEPNGATRPAIVMMLENASPLSIKAAGGVRTYEEAMAMIALGVKRIGTSAAKAIANATISDKDY